MPKDYPLINIILPAYNCETFIAKALDSLVNQDIPVRNYEVFITDDGSTDSTGSICDEYAEKNPFIHVIHTNNYGPSHARNAALTHCNGEYITFCDADDYVSPQTVSVLTKALDVFGRPDILVWHYFYDEDFPASGFPMYDVQKMTASDGKFYDREEFCLRILRDNIVGGFTWNKLINRKLITVGFNETIKVCMDHYWWLDLVSRNTKLRVCSIHYYLYCYVMTPNFGQTRDPSRIYEQNGMNRFITTFTRELDLSLPAKAITLIKRSIYSQAIYTLWMRTVIPSQEVHTKLISYTRKYAKDFYSSPTVSLKGKVKTLIKHILCLLHIHKPSRK